MGQGENLQNKAIPSLRLTHYANYDEIHERVMENRLNSLDHEIYNMELNDLRKIV